MMATGATAHEPMDVQVELSVENTGWGAMILGEMDALRESGHTCDLALMATDGSTVRAHSGVLSAASSFFTHLFPNVKQLSASVNEVVVIKVTFTREVISRVLDFLYRGKTLPLMSQIPEIKRAAKAYHINSLISLCDIFTAQNAIPATTTPALTPAPAPKPSVSDMQYSGLPYMQPTSLNTPTTNLQTEVSFNSNLPVFDSHDDNDDADSAHSYPVDYGLTGNWGTGNSGFPGYLPAKTPTSTAQTTYEPQQQPLPKPPRQKIEPGDYESKKAEKAAKRKLYRYKCEYCPKVFDSKCRMVGHRATHSGERLHKCNICGKRFVQSEYLREHIALHSDERPHKCQVCNKSFKTLRILKNHGAVHTKPYSCSVCNATFARKEKLQVHMGTHTNEKPFRCECGKAFIARDYLKSHMARYCSHRQVSDSGEVIATPVKKKSVGLTGGKRYVCNREGCPAAYRLASQIKRHINLYHGDETPINVKDFIKTEEENPAEQTQKPITVPQPDFGSTVIKTVLEGID